jgi:hypothetical protein
MAIVLLRILVTHNPALSRLVPIACVVVACLAIASPAEAYLDPGTGSMLLSAIIGVAAAVGLAVKMFWYRLVGLVRGKPRASRPGVVDGAPSADE